ncbi:MAG: tyrosine-type recombinase/integrase [Phycisphaerales bacterium]
MKAAGDTRDSDEVMHRRHASPEKNTEQAESELTGRTAPVSPVCNTTHWQLSKANAHGSPEVDAASSTNDTHNRPTTGAPTSADVRSMVTAAGQSGNGSHEEASRFYEPVWAYGEYQLVRRPDTPNLFISFRPKHAERARRISTRTADLETAQNQLIAFARHGGKPAPSPSTDASLLEVLRRYAQHQEQQGCGHPHALLAALKHFTAFCDQTRIETVAAFDLDAQQRYIEWRRRTLTRQGHTASNGTLNRELGVMKAALRWSWKRGRLDSVPHVQLLSNPPPRDRFLRTPEVRRLLDACEADHLRLYVMLALHTLQRPGAIFGLRLEQVDLDWGRIDFASPGMRQTRKRRPVVPITPSLRPYLESAMMRSRTGHVLEYDGRPVRSVKRAFATACRRAGLSDVTPYTLRHTGATLMAAAGVPLRQIAGMLGHSESRTTEIYAKHHPDFLMDASRALETLFGESPGTMGTARGHLPGTVGSRHPSLSEEIRARTEPEWGTPARVVRGDPRNHCGIRRLAGAAEKDRTSGLSLTKEGEKCNG